MIEAACRLLEQALHINPNLGIAWTHERLDLKLARQPNGSRKLFQHALRLSPRDPPDDPHLQRIGLGLFTRLATMRKRIMGRTRLFGNREMITAICADASQARSSAGDR